MRKEVVNQLGRIVLAAKPFQIVCSCLLSAFGLEATHLFLVSFMKFSQTISISPYRMGKQLFLN